MIWLQLCLRAQLECDRGKEIRSTTVEHSSSAEGIPVLQYCVNRGQTGHPLRHNVQQKEEFFLCKLSKFPQLGCSASCRAETAVNQSGGCLLHILLHHVEHELSFLNRPYESLAASDTHCCGFHTCHWHHLLQTETHSSHLDQPCPV